jgi:predicted transcriptional regulator
MKKQPKATKRVVGINVEDETIRHLKKFAEKDRRSLSNMVQVALASYVASREKGEANAD